MHVVVDVKYMHTNFSGRALPGLGDIATFKNGQISLSEYPRSSKNLIDWNRLKKFMQVGIDVKCMHTNFSARALPCFRDKIIILVSYYTYCSVILYLLPARFSFLYTLLQLPGQNKLLQL